LGGFFMSTSNQLSPLSPVDEDQTQDALVCAGELSFSVVSATDRQPLAKRFWLSGGGELQTETVVALADGEISIEHASSISAFAERLDRLETHQAVVYGIPAAPNATIVTQKRYRTLGPEERRGVIARTREHIQFAPAPGCAMLDFDAAGAPQGLLDAAASPDQTRELLIQAVPELAAAPMLWRPSSSSYLYDGPRKVHGLRGQRIYVPVARASDIPSLGELLYERLWLRGYGFFVISASGQLLDRTLLDRMVWQPERLDFAAGPVCVPPLERRVPGARIWNPSEPFFDMRTAAGLRAEERREIETKRNAAKGTQRDAARERREQWARERGKAIAAKAGVQEDVAAAIAMEAVEHRVLRPAFLLQTEDGETVSVGELLAAPDAWHERRFHDPLEPEYRDDGRIAWANLRPGTGRPYLYSHAHGGVRYTLSGQRPTIRLVEGDLPRVVDQCVDVIVAEGKIYQMKDQLARITDEGRLAPVASEWIIDWLQRHAEFERYTSRTGWCPTDLTPKYAQTILAKRGEMGPFLRPDGSVVDEPGYDEATQVLYCATGACAPTVRRQVTVALAEDVLRQLWAPFAEFPFAGDVDRGSVLALLLTAALRPGMAISPGGLIASHEAGSGKTLCAQAIANLTGVPAFPQAMSQEEEETRKSLFSVARYGTPSVLYDNVGRDRAVDSASLAMVLTSGTIADRILGESTYSKVPFRSLLLLTGNNPRIIGDLNRRLLRVRITPRVENPWQRVFAFCPRERTEANWLNLHVGALELVLAALADGPPPLDGGSGYPDWDRLVRATVCWVAKRLDIGKGFADPARSLLAGYEEDPERDRLQRLLRSLSMVFGTEPVTVRHIVERIDNLTLPVQSDGQESSKPETLGQLDDVLREIDPRRSGHAIGIYFGQHKGQIVDGLELVGAGKDCGSSRWTVRRAGPEPAPTSSRLEASLEEALPAGAGAGVQ
jgi:hypothetical protein